MSLILRNLPAEPSAWPQWLEQQIVDRHLAVLVAELEALALSVDSPSPTIEEVCGDDLTTVHERGLSALTSEQIRDLMRYPELLLPLQESVLTHGGEYWSGVPRPAESAERCQAAWTQVAGACGIAAAEISVASEPRFSNTSSSSTSAFGRRRWIVAISSSVAALLFGVGVWFSRTPSPTWGFDRNGLLTADISGETYLNSLADAADDWFNKRPEERQTVLRRLKEFSHGCDTLISAPHSQIREADRQWLVDRCRAWKQKILSQAKDLEAGRVSPIEARDAADATVRKLQQALRDRATGLTA